MSHDLRSTSYAISTLRINSPPLISSHRRSIHHRSDLKSSRMTHMNLRAPLLSLVVLFFVAWIAATPKTLHARAPQSAAPAQAAPAAHSFGPDTVIYVSDFELDSQNVTPDQGTA